MENTALGIFAVIARVLALVVVAIVALLLINIVAGTLIGLLVRWKGVQRGPDEELQAGSEWVRPEREADLPLEASPWPPDQLSPAEIFAGEPYRELSLRGYSFRLYTTRGVGVQVKYNPLSPRDVPRTQATTVGRVDNVPLEVTLNSCCDQLRLVSRIVPRLLRQPILETSIDRLFQEGTTPERAKRVASGLACRMAFRSLCEWGARILPAAISGAGAGFGVASGLAQVAGSPFHPMVTAAFMLVAAALSAWASVRELLRTPQR